MKNANKKKIREKKIKKILAKNSINGKKLNMQRKSWKKRLKNPGKRKKNLTKSPARNSIDEKIPGTTSKIPEKMQQDLRKKFKEFNKIL